MKFVDYEPPKTMAPSDTFMIKIENKARFITPIFCQAIRRKVFQDAVVRTQPGSVMKTVLVHLPGKTNPSLVSKNPAMMISCWMTGQEI